MERETIENMSAVSIRKLDFLKKSPLKYFISSMLAGIYVGLGIILIFSIGAPFKEANSPFLKILMGVSFSLALTLVVFAGSELFTGNNMTMIIGNLEKKVRWKDTLILWGVCYAGNLVGSVLLALIMLGTGFLHTNPLNSFIVSTSLNKMTLPFSQLFFRGILCNVLVCLAIWTSTRAKHEVSRLILIFWCLFGFIGSGFEHSVANMTLLSMGIFAPNKEPLISWIGFSNNLIPVTLGNIVGGAFFVGFVYWYISSKSENSLK